MAHLRMTAQSKANIKAALSAHLEPGPNGGYLVFLKGPSGTGYVENANGSIAYNSMAAAKNAVSAHNTNIKPELKPTI
jgi:hypothetical protein